MRGEVRGGGGEQARWRVHGFTGGRRQVADRQIEDAPVPTGIGG